MQEIRFGSYLTCKVPPAAVFENGETVVGRVLKVNDVSYTVRYKLKKGYYKQSFKTRIWKHEAVRAKAEMSISMV